MEFNGTFLVSIITFLVFVYLMNKVLYAPMAEIVAKRKELIEGNYEEAEQISKKADELEADMKDKLDSARDSAREQYGNILNEYKDKRADIIKEAQDSAHAELESSYALLGNVSNEAKESLKSSMTDLANDIAEKVLGYRSEIQGFDNDSINEILYH